MNVSVDEFVPAEYTQCEDGFECDSGVVTGTVTPTLEAVAEKLESISFHTTTTQDELLFGDFESGEVEAVCCGVEEAFAVPESTIDFISNIVD